MPMPISFWAKCTIYDPTCEVEVEVIGTHSLVLAVWTRLAESSVSLFAVPCFS